MVEHKWISANSSLGSRNFRICVFQATQVFKELSTGLPIADHRAAKGVQPAATCIVATSGLASRDSGRSSRFARLAQQQNESSQAWSFPAADVTRATSVTKQTAGKGCPLNLAK